MSALVEVQGLRVQYRTGGLLAGAGSTVRAVDGVSLGIAAGECFGLVGESGCGKSTLGRAILRIAPIAEGRVIFDGTDITRLSARALAPFRRNMQMVFQDPYSSLNPRMTVERIVAEPLRTHERLGSAALRARVAEALEMVGLDPARMGDLPQRFSGGQRQRIGIARALAARPRFVLCDEATSALDVSIRAQILNLLQELRRTLGLTYLMISHDLGALRQMCDRVGVMYLGRLVEVGPARQVFDRPAHPYTRSLMSAVPVPDPGLERSRTRIVLQGDVPSPLRLPQGCAFHTRCWLYEALGRPDRCRQEAPVLAGREARTAACHFQDRMEGALPAAAGGARHED
jgi:oligopeptide/dipeptide ABC transporter ATP-binding protein